MRRSGMPATKMTGLIISGGSPMRWCGRSPMSFQREGLALEVAAGAAPAGLFLARRGLRVIALDVSEAGLRLAQQRARKRSLPLSMAVMDMEDPWLPICRFDIILNFYFLSRLSFARYRLALKPGGWLFFETFVQDSQRRGNPAHALEPGELCSAFKDWDILHCVETRRRRGGKYVLIQNDRPTGGSKTRLEEKEKR